MTREEIEALPAGRELDALVSCQVCGRPAALKPMYNTGCDGFVPCPFCERPGDYGGACAQEHQGEDYCREGEDGLEWVPAYSADIAAAWQVVEELGVDGWEYEIGNSGEGERKHYTLLVSGGPATGVWELGDGPTPPLAICRAALLALAAESCA